MNKTIEIPLLDFILKVVSDKKFDTTVKSYEGFISAKSALFRPKNADLWLFSTVFSNFRLLREIFLEVC